MKKALTKEEKIKLTSYLSGFITPKRLALFDRIIRFRTDYITVVLEDIFQPHNASAVLRTCDCFGIQDVHIIENQNKYDVNPDVALGSSKWLSLYTYNQKENNTLSAIESLKSNGYRIIATTPHENDCLLEDLNLSSKIALLFGTELNGLSDMAIKHSDEFVKIPMVGFTESLNISVSAAICLHYLSGYLRKSDINWHLSEDKIIDIKLNWLRQSVKRSDLLEKKFLKI